MPENLTATESADHFRHAAHNASEQCVYFRDIAKHCPTLEKFAYFAVAEYFERTAQAYLLMAKRADDASYARWWTVTFPFAVAAHHAFSRIMGLVLGRGAVNRHGSTS